MVEISRDILIRAANIFEQGKQKDKERGRKSAANRIARERQEIALRTEKIISGLEDRILRAASRRQNHLTVIGLIDNNVRKDSPSFADPSDYFYDYGNPVDRSIYNQVYKECQEKGLNPKEHKIDRSYGEDIFPPVHFIVINW